MDRERIPLIVTIVTLVAAGGSFALWLASDPGYEFDKRLPPDFPDPRAAERVNEGPGNDRSVVTAGTGSAPEGFSGIWSMYRGPDLDKISKEDVGLADSWPDGGPEVLWQREVGEGYAMPAVWKGKCYLLDYDFQRKGDLIRCMSLETGEDIWTHFYPIEARPNHGISRSTPAINDKYVVTLSANLFVACLNAQSGELLWGMDLVAKYGTENPDWFSAQSPILDGETAVFAPAGSKLMVAVDCASGEILWETEMDDPALWQMTHSSITPIEFDGRKMYVYAASHGVAGVDAETGQVAWTHKGWVVPTANVPAPVQVAEDKLFLTGGYGAGSRLIKLVAADDGSITTETVYNLAPEVFACYQMTPIFYKGKLYGVTEDIGDRAGQLLCFDPAGKGSVIWASGQDAKFVWGPYVIADEKIYVMNDTGQLRMAEATAAGYKELGKADFMGPFTDARGRTRKKPLETWGPLTIVDGRLLCRDMFRLFCLDISAQ